MKLIVSIDTEADNQWEHGNSLSIENINHWGQFQLLCEKHGILPTYLITTEIATSPQAANFLRRSVETGKAEVGAHLHPWTTGPFHDQPGLRFNDPVHAFPNQLPLDLFRDKLVMLTSQIKESIGSAPSSFRAGRFGFDELLIDVLLEQGYYVDSSITPSVSHKKDLGLDGQGGPDFKKMSVVPSITTGKGKDNFVEIPVTILFTKQYLRLLPKLVHPYNKLAGSLNRFLKIRIASQPLWLRPWPRMNASQLNEVWKEAKRMGLPYVVLMFHSSELMPGSSTYRPTKESVLDLLDTLEGFFKFVRSDGGEGITLSKAAQAIIQDKVEQKV